MLEGEGSDVDYEEEVHRDLDEDLHDATNEFASTHTASDVGMPPAADDLQVRLVMSWSNDRFQKNKNKHTHILYVYICFMNDFPFYIVLHECYLNTNNIYVLNIYALNIKWLLLTVMF